MDLRHECYIISRPEFLHFLIRRSACFVAYFHIWTSKSLCEQDWHNNEKLKLLSLNKTRVHSCNFKCANNVCNNWIKSIYVSNISAELFNIALFDINSVGKVIKFFLKLQRASPIFLKRRFCNSKMVWFAFKTASFDSKKHFYWGISTSINLFYVHFPYLTKNAVYASTKSNRFIMTKISAILQYFSCNTAESKTLKRLKAHIL